MINSLKMAEGKLSKSLTCPTDQKKYLAKIKRALLHINLLKILKQKLGLTDNVIATYRILWPFISSSMKNFSHSRIMTIEQPKFNKVRFFLPFSNFMKHPQTNFTVIPWATQKLLGQKSQNLSLGHIFLAAEFLFYQYFIEIKITDIDMLLQV